MALITCPECGKEISDQASACINCGCPMDIILTKIEVEKNKPLMIYACNRCGGIIWNKEAECYKKKYCNECRHTNAKYQLIELPITCEEFESKLYQRDPNDHRAESYNKHSQSIIEAEKEYYEKYVKDWDSLDKKCLQYGLNIESLYQNNKGPAHDVIHMQVQQQFIDKKAESKKANQPKCPTCGSVNVKKISAASTVFGAGMFGLFSKTARSQFECKNCGYKF